MIKTKLFETEGTRLLREYASEGDPQAQVRRGGSRTARGKRVPGVEITVRYPPQKTVSTVCNLPIDFSQFVAKRGAI
ncbi:hypothetical protein KEH51_14010 [[Brevibacterium] frigoritolerans]|uniref:Uncharacterized protein n=1 Tax=Peribacillus frigoritolerans TaxID=450367 RepID=A0A941FJ71_9BACI|nr:hypothetical protein [Peribacillus frigoritolerans]